MMKAILTGHSRGLGAAIAVDLIGRQIPTLGLSRRHHPDLKTLHGELLKEVEIDLGDETALRRWLGGETLRQFLQDATNILLINNAGVVEPMGPLDTQILSSIAKSVALNVTAPLMLAAATAAARGKAELRIVHVSSGAGRKAYAGWNIYCATKAALDHHARAVVKDNTAAARDTGLKICSLAPGIVDTDMQASLREAGTDKFPLRDDFIAMKRDGDLSKPEDTAAKFMRYLLSDRFGEDPVADLREITI